MGMFKTISPGGSNPNPRNFQFGTNWFLLPPRYPECTNFEGKKILVWHGTVKGHLDPRNKTVGSFDTLGHS